MNTWSHSESLGHVLEESIDSLDRPFLEIELAVELQQLIPSRLLRLGNVDRGLARRGVDLRREERRTCLENVVQVRHDAVVIVQCLAPIGGCKGLWGEVVVGRCLCINFYLKTR